MAVTRYGLVGAYWGGFDMTDTFLFTRASGLWVLSKGVSL